MFRTFRVVLLAVMLGVTSLSAEDLQLTLRYQSETSAGSSRYHQLARQESWDPSETAIIVCDVWDLHHSQNAVRRIAEFGPRLDKVLTTARQRGVTVIHSPSDCMAAYTDHPARRRALETPRAAELPDDIRSWCSRIPAEEQAVYPLDQSDGGDDDDPDQHAVWAAKLKEIGRNPGLPWQKQSDLIRIDAERDYISDRGDEVWSILADRGIKNVILTGVHTNMCVLGRPFGLRQMARNGKHVVLMRDMTDTMYNPGRWPYVSHFTGNDLIIRHIERFICPTITGDQLIGGEPFRFQHDRRPHLVIVMAEDEYETQRTLPEFGSHWLGQEFRVTQVYGSDQQRNEIPNLAAIADADVVLLSIRRRTLRPEQLELVKQYVRAGKPVVGLRTASHAFSLRNAQPPAGHAEWPEFDAEVFGGNYTNHYGNKLPSTVQVVAEAASHPILTGLTPTAFPQGGSLYKTSPLASSATTLLTGSVEAQPAEPVAWTFRREDGGRSFYTSLGHPRDFKNQAFITLLRGALYWAADLPPAGEAVAVTARQRLSQHWSLVPVPASWEQATGGGLKDYAGAAWYRCSVRLREEWIDPAGITLQLPGRHPEQAWFNGQPLRAENTSSKATRYRIQPEWIEANDANLLVVRLAPGDGDRGWRDAPRVFSGDRQLELAGRWQFRIGDEPGWSNIPLPARYGTSTDIVFEP